MAFGSLLTAMVTPFTTKGEVNYQVARGLCLKLKNEGTEGIVVGGTTGESPTLTREERSRLLEVVLEEVGDSVRVIAGTGTNSTRDSVDLTQMAERVGAHGIMLVTPYYNKPPQAGLVEHFKRVAGSTSLPVMLYNVPGRTSVNLSIDSLEDLWKVSNIVALKEATGDLDRASEISRRMPGSFSLYSGDDSLTLPLLSVGATGVVSVASHVVGLQIKAMIDEYKAGRVIEARNRHLELFPLFKALFITTNPIPVKAALCLMGMDVGSVRQPLTEATAQQMAVLKECLVAAGLIR